MNEKDEQLYWKGVYFPGTLNKKEFNTWTRLKQQVEVNNGSSVQEQERWDNYFGAFVVFLLITAFIL